MARSSRVQVQFNNRVAERRQPYGDEYSVMRHFSKHVNSCRVCVVPADPQGNILLCPKGYLYANDVRRYLYRQNGKVISSKELQPARDRLEVEVPARFAVVSRLLSELPHTHQRHNGRGFEIPSNHRKLNVEGDLQGKNDLVTVSATIPTTLIRLHIKRLDLKMILESGGP